MIRIVLTEEQMQAIAGVDEPIDLFAPSGRMIGRVSSQIVVPPSEPKLSPAQLAEIKRRMAEAEENPDAFTTWDEIKARLHSQESA